MSVTAESQILRAYALASQHKYEDAIRILEADPDVLTMRTGAELLARIRLEQGDPRTALQIWLQILRQNPDDGAARKAVEVLRHGMLPRQGKILYWTVGVASFVLALCVSACLMRSDIGRGCPKCQREVVEIVETNQLSSQVVEAICGQISSNLTEHSRIELSGGIGDRTWMKKRRLLILDELIRSGVKAAVNLEILVNTDSVTNQEYRIRIIKD